MREFHLIAVLWSYVYRTLRRYRGIWQSVAGGFYCNVELYALEMLCLNTFDSHEVAHT
jgi:hypothetical protein